MEDLAPIDFLGPPSGLDWYRDPERRKHLPHLKKVFVSETQAKSNISLYDYNEKWKPLQTRHFTIAGDKIRRIFDSLLRHDFSGIDRRVVVIEDISQHLIQALVKMLDLNPEFFENHFIDAAFSDRKAPDLGLHASEWPTRRLRKDFCSVSWPRPYLLKVPKSVTVTISEGSMLYGNEESPASRRAYFGGNIYRRHCQFQSDRVSCATDLHGSEGLHGGSRFALEERITLWRGRYKGLELVILLVDKGVSDSVVSYESREPQRQSELAMVVRKDGKQTVTTLSAISKTHTSGVGDRAITKKKMTHNTTNQPSHDHQNEVSGVTDTMHEAVGALQSPQPSTHINNAENTTLLPTRDSPVSIRHPTIGREDVDLEAGRHVATTGLDAFQRVNDSVSNQPHTAPAPFLLEGMQIEMHAAKSGTAAVSPSQNAITDAQFESMDLNNLPPLPVSAATSVSSLSQSSVTPSGPRASDKHMTGRSDRSKLSDKIPVLSQPLVFCPTLQKNNSIVRNVASRCPTEGWFIDKAINANLFEPLTSTRQDLGLWLAYSSESQLDAHLSFGPISNIHKIIGYDIADFLQLVHRYLDEITILADNELILNRNILTWRQMIWFFGKSLRQLILEYTEFSNFLAPVADDDDPLSIRSDTADILRKVSLVQSRLDAASTVLASSISVAEARRGVSEAEGVTRLTELAFIYIPLSFAASFFGMQVKELDPSTTSIGGFFGLAIGVTMSSYLLRLIIRSHGIIMFREVFIKRVRAYAKTPEASPTRTRDVLRYLAQPITRRMYETERSRLVAGCLLLLAPTLPMIAVWTREELVKGMKIAISIEYLVVLCCCFLAWMLRSISGRLVLSRSRKTNVSDTESERSRRNSYTDEGW